MAIVINRQGTKTGRIQTKTPNESNTPQQGRGRPTSSPTTLAIFRIEEKVDRILKILDGKK